MCMHPFAKLIIGTPYPKLPTSFGPMMYIDTYIYIYTHRITPGKQAIHHPLDNLQQLSNSALKYPLRLFTRTWHKSPSPKVALNTSKSKIVRSCSYFDYIRGNLRGRPVQVPSQLSEVHCDLSRSLSVALGPRGDFPSKAASTWGTWSRLSVAKTQETWTTRAT